MESYRSDETFLARWAAGELTEEELLEFEKSETFKEFNRINEASQGFKAPPIDLDNALIEVNEKITFGTKRKSAIRIAVAASISVLITAYALLFSTKSYKTTFGEQLSVVLPDGSEVRLNAASELSHKRFFWLNDKKIILEGEGFFEVKKGDGFHVATSYGTTSVLGTKFNVRARRKSFSVNCLEGKVQFQSSGTNENFVLDAGSGVSMSEDGIKKYDVGVDLPRWMNQMSVFRDTPLSEIIEEIKLQYGVKFETNNTDLSELFSGSFIHTNLEGALQTTLTPMGITYELDSKKGIVILQ